MKFIEILNTLGVVVSLCLKKKTHTHTRDGTFLTVTRYFKISRLNRDCVWLMWPCLASIQGVRDMWIVNRPSMPQLRLLFVLLMICVWLTASAAHRSPGTYLQTVIKDRSMQCLPRFTVCMSIWKVKLSVVVQAYTSKSVSVHVLCILEQMQRRSLVQ